MTAEAFPQLGKKLPKTSTEKAITPKILIADPDKSWQDWYRRELKEIANIVIVDNCTDANQILDGKGFNIYTKDFYFNAYVIEPVIPKFKWPKAKICQGSAAYCEPSQWGYDEGLELIRKIGELVNDYDLIWVISAYHKALKETGKLYSSTFPIQHIYTKNPLEKAEGYPTKKRFLEDIITALGKKLETDSDIF